MARNAEKAMTALARWNRMKDEEAKGPTIRRPNRVEECKDLGNAETFRREVLREISKKITSIQNPGLGEYKIRDLNDDINRMLRIKYKWEERIKELGGPDYKKIAPKQLDREGREVPGNRGYKYFGAAKDLPGVRELFQPVQQEAARKNRAELSKLIDADYYGYMDDDDGILMPLEREAELAARAEAVDAWKQKKGIKDVDEDETNIYAVPDDGGDEDDGAPITEVPPALQSTSADPNAEKRKSTTTKTTSTGADRNTTTTKKGPISTMEVDEKGQPKFISQVNVPSQAQIEEALIHKKKRDLFAAYCSDVLVEQSNQARVLLGYDSSISGSASKTSDAASS